MTMIKIWLANKLHECLSMYPFTTTRRNFQLLFGTIFFPSAASIRVFRVNAGIEEETGTRTHNVSIIHARL